VGYLQKRSQAEQWIVTEQDLEIKYAQSGEKNSLWCDHLVEDPIVPLAQRDHLLMDQPMKHLLLNELRSQQLC